MNIEEAKTISISVIAEKLGARFHKRTKPHVTVWFSPLRTEKSPSFYIDERDNTFKDFGHHLPKGDVIDLVIDFYEWKRNDAGSTRQALKFLEGFDTIPRITLYKETAKQVTYSDHFVIKKLSDRFSDRSCVGEIVRRNLSKVTVSKYLKQAKVMHKNGSFEAFAFPNDKGGHEISTYDRWGKPIIKSCIGPKAITRFPAHPDATDITVYVFTGKFDLITWDQLKGGQKPNEEYICSNGDSMITFVGEYIVSKKDQIARVLLFGDHDEQSRSGEKAMHALADILEAEDVHFGSMDHLYDGHKDLSAANMNSKTTLQNNYKMAGPTFKPRF